MNDLTDMLRDSSEQQPPGLGLDPADLVRRGRGRVHRRRALTAGGCALVLAAVAAVGSTWHLGGDTKTQIADPTRGLASYQAVRISPAAVTARCTPILDAEYGGHHTWVEVPEHDGTKAGRRIETRVGHDAAFEAATPSGHGAHRHAPAEDCSIPQAKMVAAATRAVTSTPDPRAANHAAVVRACSTEAGYDLKRWALLESVDDDGSAVALFRAANGFIAECDLGGAYLSFSRDPATEPLSALDGGYLEPDNCAKVGVLPGGRDGMRIEILDGQRTVATATTSHRGAFALNLNRSWPRHGRAFRGRVLDAHGAVVWSGEAARPGDLTWASVRCGG
ncbi:MAG: hypothetical protein FWE71_05665 [Nocardioidaceae bacterium]|nr:hypothetical protein [Nocardioidaceae bacterium]MCL2613552.1 hypothetical protein [Nocardioidaceae bacterium]